MTQPTQYSNTSTLMTLTVGVDAVNAQITVNDASGLPIAFPYNLAIDADTSLVEIVQVTATAGNVLTVNRGEQDTPAKAHSVGALVFHAWTAGDGWQMQDHIFGSAGVHGLGVGSDVVGTTDVQTLTNKTMSGLDNTFTNLPGGAITPVFGNTDINQESLGIGLEVTGFDGSASAAVQVLTADTQHGLIVRRKTAAAGTGAAIRVENESGTAVFTVTKQGRMTATTTGITQDQAAVAGLTVTANASASTATTHLVGAPGAAALHVRRNNSTTTGDLQQWANESSTVMASYTRGGQLNLTQPLTNVTPLFVVANNAATFAAAQIICSNTAGGLLVQRNNATVGTQTLQEWRTETGSAMAWVTRDGTIRGSDVQSTGNMLVGTDGTGNLTVNGTATVSGNINWGGSVTVQVFDSAVFNSTSLTFVDIVGEGIAFVAPPSGRSLVLTTAFVDSAGGFGIYARLGFVIRTGATVGSGTVFLGASDDRAIWAEGNLGKRNGMQELVSGLTPGSTYNFQWAQHTSDTGFNSVSLLRTVTVVPVL